MSEPTITIEPLPCFVCGKLPKVGSFPLMDLRHYGWSCLCPSKCYETETYYSREGAVGEWNAWVESEGFDDFEDYDYDKDDDETDAGGVFDEQRYSRVCRLLEEALTLMSEWGT